MQTAIPLSLLQRPEIAEADAILRSCVHCGFCTATCPTYQLLGSELDGPRGRIYLIKEMLEGNASTEKTRLHLDRCLTCRSCETTCPSGVQYGRLVDIGRNEIERRAPRPWWSRLIRAAMLGVMPYTPRMRIALFLGKLASPLLPAMLRKKLPRARAALPRPLTNHARHMLVLEGCVQPLTAPTTNTAAARVLDKLGISLISAPEAGCCGAMDQHMSAAEAARKKMRRNIDAWWPHIERGAEAIVMTASGCGVMVKDYGHALQDDPVYAAKAAQISLLTMDLSEVLRKEDLSQFAGTGQGKRVACQSSCTLQHGQKLGGVVEKILQQCGYTLTPVADSHLCCGAAGTYTLLQPVLSQQLLHNKLNALEQGKPEVIVTSNIGCQLHLESASKIPVRHWIELLAPDLA
ncbi:MAG: glycolate oxidase iron-sulfur subunit [Gallionellales bacterium 35-53-114]|jgi:glycolate oxidase iron-sulfur subunit|nr:MAG: glycolate oxidase iron-sulfur subunit [Gallionellales bacterium 35-53-114]OYZ63196.1 MAG: glycolate oxidase iron-sulfur subunit [Gallionellales bacterium 24-53-125]OZB08662.1 MAG: glycolate oxidase iron-sulfur subunit [Gallionellales bacterium 39-52-133]HQS57481.1 glycolate oxidase subunit GlcF [Gallionellaceae bacterium]HQS74331.1 glycolate oxidase subunit GlcF [Gallionellaceae bacterium]